MLVAVVLASLAGFGRDRQLEKLQQTSGSFLVGLIMTVIAGITSAGLWLAFIYCQGPIQSRVCIVETGTKIDVSVTRRQEALREVLGRQGRQDRPQGPQASRSGEDEREGREGSGARRSPTH